MVCIDMEDVTGGTAIGSNISYYNGFNDSSSNFRAVSRFFHKIPNGESHQIIVYTMQNCINNLSVKGDIVTYKIK